MRASLLWLLLAMPACTWVSKADVEGRLGEVDDDADGFIASEDCDDDDGTIFPGAEEVWYDGIDANCGDDDDYDADADGVTKATDCDDEEPETYPGAADAWYDGVDSDCGGEDDYDADADGFVTDDYVGLATTNAQGTGALPGGDCDDADATINPDAVDVWYDGVDTDCAGEDDYDADADGYVPDTYEGLETTYVEGSGALPAGDCDDEADTTYPGASDDWYDGVDADCAEDDDYDHDGDGHQIDGVGDDCDDDDALAFPGAIETLEDGVDQDCDGGDSTFPFDGLGEGTTFEVTTGHNLRVAANSADLFLSVSAQEMTWTTTSTSTTYHDAAVAMDFELADLHEGGVSQLLAWAYHLTDPTSYYLTFGQGFVATEEAIFGATGLNRPGTTRTLRVGGRTFSSVTPVGQSYTISGDYADFSAITVALDGDGDLHAVGCDASSGPAQYVWADLSELYSTGTVSLSLDIMSEISDFVADTCTLHFEDDPSVGTLLATQDGLMTSTELSITETGRYPFEPYDATAGLRGWDWIVGVDTGADTGIDTGRDTGIDTGTDTGIDTGIDTGTDTGTDTGADTGTDTGADTGTVEDDGIMRPFLAESYAPYDIEIVMDGADLYRVFYDGLTGDIVVVNAASEAWTVTSVSAPTPVRAMVAADGTLYLAWAAEGEAWMAWGQPDGTAWTSVSADPGFDVEEAAIWVSGDATDTTFDLVLAALGSESLLVGTARVTP